MPDPVPKRTVFLVDDHPLVREWLTALINQQPDLVTCGEASGAPEALRMIEEVRPNVAVVDLTLASGSGLELIKDLKACCPGTALIVLSMHEESLYAERVLRAGASGYIMKRESTKKVISAIRRVLEGELFVSEAVTAAMAQKFLGSKQNASYSVLDLLSDRELEVFQLLGQGLETRRIAEDLRVSIKTVQAFCARIKEKLKLDNATELLREAIRWQEARQRGSE